MQRDNQIWTSLEELAAAITAHYSVTDPTTTLAQYLEQVKQYPLYLDWFDRIEAILRSLGPLEVIEYGSGPGILAQRVSVQCSNCTYTAVEPSPIFRNMTLAQHPKAQVVDQTAETYSAPTPADFIIATATYHHFHDKPTALSNIFRNLKPGGTLIIADTFLPHYEFNAVYDPTNKAAFIDCVMRYVSAQIYAMPNPSLSDIADQVRTAMLDTIRIEELKVCVDILKHQLDSMGFVQTKIELMIRDDVHIPYEELGWYFITTKKPTTS